MNDVAGFIAEGANASAADQDGDTPLSDAYSNGAPDECVELLLKASNQSTGLETDKPLLYIPPPLGFA